MSPASHKSKNELKNYSIINQGQENVLTKSTREKGKGREGRESQAGPLLHITLTIAGEAILLVVVAGFKIQESMSQIRSSEVAVLFW